MRVVLDTNVVVSGVFFGGTPGQVRTARAAGRFALVLSPAILDEYRRVGQDLGRRHPSLAATRRDQPTNLRVKLAGLQIE